MQNSFIQTQGDNVVINQNQLIMYAIAAAVVVLAIVVITFALKRRKKDFIKTMPTNLKDGE